MSDKEKYHILCNTEKTIPLFSQDWWLDSVCGKEKWDVLIIENKGQVQATMPFYIPYKGVISMPPFTQTMGPWYAPVSNDTKYSSLLSLRHELTKQLIEGIKNYPYFLQNFHHSVTDWLPFYWNGFTQTTRYTYILPSLSDKDTLWEQMSGHTRRNIEKAKEKNNITVKKGIDPEALQLLYTRTFQRQGKNKAPHTALLKKLATICRERQQGDIWGGYDKEGNLHAAAFIVWQNNYAYYIAGGADPDLRSSGAQSLVMWEAVQFVSGQCDVFDFEGSMIPGVERFFREFGARQMPYFSVSKGNLSLAKRAWFKLKNLI